MLTRRQAQTLRFIDEQQRATGVTPSYDEIRLGIGLRGKSGVARIIGALESRGFVRKLHQRSRSIEILRLPSHADRDPVMRERERCARIAESFRHGNVWIDETARAIAQVIRSGASHFPTPPKSDR